MARRRLLRRAGQWPEVSPGAINAWLVLVTTKTPDWKDNLFEWRETPPTFGEPSESFFYPDPMGFWVEVRRWATALLQRHQPDWSTADALAVTALLHVGDDPGRLSWARDLMKPRVLLFLDEPSFEASGVDVDQQLHHIPDPHRPGQVYEGFWGVLEDGAVVGKSPQHPAAHRFYDRADMETFLRLAPLPAPAPPA